MCGCMSDSCSHALPTRRWAVWYVNMCMAEPESTGPARGSSGDKQANWHIAKPIQTVSVKWSHVTVLSGQMTVLV